MRLTAELHWFWPRLPPSDFERWFVTAASGWGAADHDGERRDGYVPDAHATALGIKRREGTNKVEIKGLVAIRAAVVEFASRTCRVELWSKWSTQALDLYGVRLVCVSKQRWMGKFEISSIGLVELPPAAAQTKAQSATSAAGCNVELTTVKGPGASQWWTLGFEAHGDLDQVEGVLSATVTAMSQRDPPALRGGEAKSYPAWLADRNW